MSLQEAYKKIKEWTSSKPPIRRLATQEQLSQMEIRFCNCVIVYKLKHIETQACKYKRRKVAKNLGYSFRSLRSSSAQDEMFDHCIFNPSDRSIVQEHILNLETVKLRFTNCRFLRRDERTNEKLRRYWRNYHGKLVKFSLLPEHFKVENEIIRLKDLPSSIESIIEETENEDLPSSILHHQHQLPVTKVNNDQIVIIVQK